MNPQEKWVARRRKPGDTDQSEDTIFEPEETNNINFLVYKDETNDIDHQIPEVNDVLDIYLNVILLLLQNEEHMKSARLVDRSTDMDRNPTYPHDSNLC